MLNDIDEVINNCSLFSFGDDTRILKVIENVLNCNEFQDDLNKIYRYAEMNRLQFNEDKFELIKFGENEHLRNKTSYKNP